MATKADRNLEEELGPSPNPFFAKKDEPWKDPKLMLKLDAKHDYQYEIAHVLGCSSSQVSYWMEKAHENWKPSLEEGDRECDYFDVCRYTTASVTNVVCNTCLSLVRHNQSNEKKPGATYIDPADSDDIYTHMELLYAEYDTFTENTP